MKRFARRSFSCIPTAAIAFAIAPFAIVNHAKGDGCAPLAPVNNTTVDCTGTTTDQNNPNGYGTGVETGNTINVQAGATVTGTQRGLLIDSGTVINNGSITASGNSFTRGISANSNVTVTNVGTISLVDVVGVTGIGVLAQGVATVDNQGTISLGSNAFGVGSNLGGVNLTNSGTISAGANGGGVLSNTSAVVNNSGRIEAAAGGIGISAASGATLDNTATGVISAGVFGVTTNATANVENAGTIQANDANGIAINAGTVNITKDLKLGGGVGNSGTISATGANGIAISAVTAATVTNEEKGVITGQQNAVFAGSAHVENAGTIQGLSGGAILAGTVDVTNSGTISAPNAVAISTDVSNAKVTNSGTITGRVGAVAAAALADVTNVAGGVMQATSVAGQSAFTIFGADVLLNNAGLIQTSGDANLNNAVQAVNNATIENSGNMLASGAGSAVVVVTSGTVDVRKNSGLMQQEGEGGSVIVGAEIAKVNNSGSMQTLGENGIAIFSPGLTTGGLVDVVSNSGIISAIGAGGVAISAGIVGGNIGSVVTVDNLRTGVIEADTQAIVSNTGSADVTNAGIIRTNADHGVAINTSASATVRNSGNIQGTGANSAAIFGNGLITVTNDRSGTISAGVLGVASALDEVKVENAGIIETTGAAGGSAIRAATSATVNNLGTVQSAGAIGFGINAAAVNATNAGRIAGNIGIFASGPFATVTNLATGVISGNVSAIVSDTGIANVSNAGTIETTSAFGGTAIQAATTATVDNLRTGTIRAGGDGTAVGANIANVTNAGLVTGGFFGIDATTVNLANTGTISSGTGIRASGLTNVGSTITNSGTIAGTGGTAIKLSPAADTLTLLPGSKIIGAIDMGGGADTINIVNNAPTLSRVSSFFRFLSVNTLNILNFTGVINANTVTVDTGGMPAVQTGDSVATLDPTAFGRADRALMNFTGGISSLVQGRLGGTAANGSAVQVVSFAPTDASSRTEEAFAAMSSMSSMSAMGYAAERTRPLTHSFTYADAPYNVWTSGFGGTSTQKGDNTMLRSVASAGAGVTGLDRQLRPDLLIGAFAGGGTGRLSVELNSQSVDTDYVTGGVYGRFDWISHFLDFTLQGGATVNKSKRLVLNNSAPGGSETATASYDSWYISPEIAYGRRYHFANGYTLTPVGRIRYLAGTFDGYNEAGSAQNLVVGRRNLNDLEERAEVELSKITGVGAGSFSASVHGGFIALQRLGNPTINTVLIGQDLSFTTPGKASTAGVVGGAGFDFRATDRMSLFGAFEATLMSDHTRTAAAKAGLKVAF